jgi:cephalosporin hydroxylase
MKILRNYFYSRYHEGFKTIIVHEIAALSIIEYFLLHEKPKLIIELGTFYCGVTALFHETDKSIEIHTFDYKDFMKDLRKAHKVITVAELAEFKTKVFSENVHFHHENILTAPNQNLIDLLKRPEKKFLYCDNGNKIQEINTYAPYLNPGDFLGCHDWGTEVFIEGIQETVDKENLHHTKFSQMLEERKCSTRLFIKGPRCA